MTWTETKSKINTIWFGIVCGLVLPFLGFYLSKFVKFPQGDYTSYWRMLVSNTHYSTEILTLSLIPNMLLFYFFFFQWRTDNATKGLLFTTLLWIFLLFIQF